MHVYGFNLSILHPPLGKLDAQNIYNCQFLGPSLKILAKNL